MHALKIAHNKRRFANFPSQLLMKLMFSQNRMRDNTRRIALLIDGDNAESSLMSEYLAETGRFGEVRVIRTYADWTTPEMKSWKDQINSYAIRPIQKFAYTKNKNSTDTALIIDAMDLLHSQKVDGFCICSSDSDYTGLAQRIREEGLFIMGIGRSMTPEAFVKSCEVFVYTEILKQQVQKRAEKRLVYKRASGETTKVVNTKIATIEAFNSKVDNEEMGTLSDESKDDTITTTDENNKSEKVSPTPYQVDWNKIDKAYKVSLSKGSSAVHLSMFHRNAREMIDDFDHRKYGYATLSKFCEAVLSPRYKVGPESKGSSTMVIRKVIKTSEVTSLKKESTQETDITSGSGNDNNNSGDDDITTSTTISPVDDVINKSSLNTSILESLVTQPVDSEEVETDSSIFSELSISDTHTSVDTTFISTSIHDVHNIIPTDNTTTNRSNNVTMPSLDSVISKPTTTTTTTTNLPDIDVSAIDRAFKMAMDINTGHCMLSRLAESLRKLDPTFDHRNYGYSSFRKFCDSLQPYYTIIVGKQNILYIIESKQNDDSDVTTDDDYGDSPPSGKIPSPTSAQLTNILVEEDENDDDEDDDSEEDEDEDDDDEDSDENETDMTHEGVNDDEDSDENETDMTHEGENDDEEQEEEDEDEKDIVSNKLRRSDRETKERVTHHTVNNDDDDDDKDDEVEKNVSTDSIQGPVDQLKTVFVTEKNSIPSTSVIKTTSSENDINMSAVYKSKTVQYSIEPTPPPTTTTLFNIFADGDKRAKKVQDIPKMWFEK